MASTSSRPTIYDGVTYESTKACAASFGVTRGALSKPLKSGFWRGRPISYAEEPGPKMTAEQRAQQKGISALFGRCGENYYRGRF